ncbi:MAG TPA: sialate O-acetylesterase [Candidatus Methylacidiphilales bacterium]|nr:sialate O-acetylesterase [Candidatus Methylacidiphilales bacterium]
MNSKIALPALFSAHAVLLKSDKTPLWGKAAPGAEITVELGEAKASVNADSSGKWRANLDLSGSGPGPFDLKVGTTSGGSHPIVIPDVLVGEVWLCSGQSNMEYQLEATTGAAKEIASSALPLLREFRVEKAALNEPAEDCKGSWEVASPSTTSRFSAVAYYFGKRVSKEMKGPVGLINSSWGGTAIESWMSCEALGRDAELKPRAEDILRENESYSKRLADFRRLYKEWEAENNREDRTPHTAMPAMAEERFASLEVDESDWKSVTMPGSLAAHGLPDTGAVWLRRKLLVTSHQIDQGIFALFLAVPRDFDQVYVNGIKIGCTTAGETTSVNSNSYSTLERRYDVPKSVVKEGENVIAMRLFSPAGNAGISPGYFCAIWCVPLDGEWLAKTEYELPPLTAAARAGYPQQPPLPPIPRYIPSALHQGMIAPLVPYAIRGALWYQGETNVGRAVQYRRALQHLVHDWREQWENNRLPVYVCQLANVNAKLPSPGESMLAEMRESQAAITSLPETGVAVLIDVGEQDDVHARNKKDVGERLAQLALNRTYGRTDIAGAGPVFKSAAIESVAEGSKIRIRIHFMSTDGGLAARPLPANYQPRSVAAETVPLIRNSPESELEGFAICGEDRIWKWAEARIDSRNDDCNGSCNGPGPSVLVWSDEVPNPVAVRYAWADNPTCNLYNGAGLPACPFRTDSFPLLTDGKRF